MEHGADQDGIIAALPAGHADDPRPSAPMRISRLKLSGFKSFVEPAELHIEPGLTGIVGPNGCGKSNLLEAIRWVMGENSPKSMRGGGMEDVIFAGTAQRPPRNFAEVALLAEVSPNVLAALDRKADPGAGEIEIVRRIERGAGSAYRANGRDVRAKDVTLIFADAATGAHSPALVSQGRIAAVIAAKPGERRQMLEEAAGIAGLHVRRRDAEQKLRATEANLTRLEQILGDMGARAEALTRQARAAERYRQLSQAIATAEARALFARWREAARAAETARADATAAEAQVTAAQTHAVTCQGAQHEALQALALAQAGWQSAREAASAIAHRIETLTREAETLRRQIADHDAQGARIAADCAREDQLTHDAAAALDALEADAETLQAAIGASERQRPDLADALTRADRAVQDAELARARASAAKAEAEAELRVADAALANARSRHDRAGEALARIDAAIAALGDAAALAQLAHEAVAERDAAAAATLAAREGLGRLDAARGDLIAARDDAQAALAAARADEHAMAREIEALAREQAAHAGSGDTLIDQVRAQPGYEAALAAALGDEIHAAIGPADGDGRFWTGETAAANHDEAAPAGCELLARHVAAPDALAAALARVFVADADNGAPLAPGQSLVTRTGRLRRWDGYVASGSGAATAERLARANRLDGLRERHPVMVAALVRAEQQLENAAGALAAHDAERSAAARALSSAESAEREALRAADQAEHAALRDQERREALADDRSRALADHEAAGGERAAAEAARGALPDPTAQRDALAALEAELGALRQDFQARQAALSALDQDQARQRERRAAIRAEIKGWQARASEAAQRLRAMQQRASELETARAALAGQPEALDDAIAAATAERDAAGPATLAAEQAAKAAEAALRAAETASQAAGEALAGAREARAGAIARTEHQDERRAELARQSGERFQCPPSLLPERHGFVGDQAFDAAAEAAEHERLVGARERLGAVNLIAADELATLQAEMTTSRAEHDELVEAIHRLRGSIGSLNREGRQRLLAAFSAVDGHFQRLFARLFNGGRAHLELVDSDDPLEAGLEIMAQPPGKRLAALTLLSGGEQALTAVALIFALFLTNPAPICVLDEVDAPLDDANIERFCDLLDMMVRETETRYLIVTHNAVTMSRMHRLFGVTMIEQGVSRLVSVDLGAAEDLLAAE